MKIFLVGFLGAWFLMQASFSAAAHKSEELVEIISKSKFHRVPGYPVGLQCKYSDTLDKSGSIHGTVAHLKAKGVLSMGEVELHVLLGEEKQDIGTFMLQFFSNGENYGAPSKDKPKSSILRIRDIFIGESFGSTFGPPHELQKKGYGTMALETLFTVLRLSQTLPDTTQVWLECPTFKAHLKPWYESFGFEIKDTPQSLLQEYVVYMAVPLSKTKFPLVKKRKKEVKATKAAVKIQAAYRGHVARKKVKEMRLAKAGSAL
jgi:hypothetical protein